MQFRKLGLAAGFAAGSFGSFVLLASAFGGDSSSAGQLIPNGNAKANGCRTGGPGGINATEPSWVPVNLRDHRKKVAEGIVMASHVTHEDFPFNHDSHDMCFFIAPDPPYQNMMSDANGMHGGQRTLEVEWETKYFPAGYWPAPGDRAWVIGRHIFDCGHPPYRTEIHPPVGVAFTRTAPMIFPGESDPVIANKTHIFFGNQGGYFVDKVGGTDYVFNVPMPPGGGRGATPKVRVLQRPGGRMPEPVLTPKIVNGQQMVEVKIPLSGVADPTVRWNLYEWIPRVRRQMSGLTWPPIDRPRNAFTYSAVVATAWNPGPAAARLGGRPGVRYLRVTFQSVKVHNDREGAVSGKGEWNMQFRANGEWIQFPERNVKSGDTIQVNQIVDLFVADNGNVQIQVNGWEDDNDSYFRVGPPPSVSSVGATNENEKLPPLFVNFGLAQNFGVGSHSIRSSPGDYTVNFTIQELRKWPPVAGTIGTIRPPAGAVRPPIRSTGGEGHR
jgi:hypothetical protein